METTRLRCERVEREKSDILLRRLGGVRETAPSSAESSRLQQRVHELQVRRTLFFLATSKYKGNLNTQYQLDTHCVICITYIRDFD